MKTAIFFSLCLLGLFPVAHAKLAQMTKTLTQDIFRTPTKVLFDEIPETNIGFKIKDSKIIIQEDGEYFIHVCNQIHSRLRTFVSEPVWVSTWLKVNGISVANTTRSVQIAEGNLNDILSLNWGILLKKGDRIEIWNRATENGAVNIAAFVSTLERDQPVQPGASLTILQVN